MEETAALEADAAVVDREVRRLESDIRKVAKGAAANEHAVDRLADLQDRMSQTEQKRTELRNQITQAQRSLVTKEEVGAALTEFDALWETLSPREQTRVLRLLIQRVDFDGANGKIALTFHANGIRSLETGDWRRTA